MITFKTQDECGKYYDAKTNTYVFGDDVTFEFNFYAPDKNIDAGDINAMDINASNIDAGDIKAANIDAGDIDYYAVCCAYRTFKCTKISGRRKNARAFCLDGEIEIKKFAAGAETPNGKNEIKKSNNSVQKDGGDVKCLR